MSERGANRSSTPRDQERIPAWLVALGVAAGLLATAVLFVAVVPALREQRSAARSTETAGTAVPTTVEEGEDTTTTTAAPVPPSGQVAYVDAQGRVLLGEGAGTPVVVASDAAVGLSDLGAVALSPTGDVVAYARNDGALVLLPVPIGGVADPPTVVATDVALDAVGAGPSLSWDPAGLQIAYLAVGTEEMAEPRPEVPPPLSSTVGVFRVPLPEGALGNVVKVVDRTGAEVVRIGDPSTRSMVSVTWSLSDDLLLLESVAPDTGKPYTLALATSGSGEELPTFLSADDPAFSPDGSFIVVVGPDNDGRELIRVATDTLDRATLTSDADICNPTVSPDSTRIVYGAGEGCERLMLVSTRGGAPVDVTPPAGPGDATFGVGALGWTQDGRHVAFADCRRTDGPVQCGGEITFLDPDRLVVTAGPSATTVAPLVRPLLQGLELDLIMSGPIEYATTYQVTAELEGDLTELQEGTSLLSVELAEEDRSLSIELQVQEGAQFATGTMTVVDPEAGIDRTFLVLGTPTVLGVRVVSLTGLWISTDDLPVISGEFRVAIRRR
jgi:hypothetical protein